MQSPGEVTAWRVFQVQPDGKMEHAPSPSWPCLSRLHGDSPLCLPHPSIPASARDSGPAGPSLLRACSGSPASSPGRVQRQPPLPDRPPSHLFFSSGSRLLGETIPTPSTCTAHQPSHPPLLKASGPPPSPRPLDHPHSQPPMPRSAFSVISLCHRFGKQASLLRCGERMGVGRGSLDGAGAEGQERP